MKDPPKTRSRLQYGEKVCSCYIFETGASSSFGWPQARDSCKYNNTHLVVLETEREWEVINKEIQTRKSFDNLNEWYIGLYKNITTGNWTWINGKPLTIDKWQTGKPTDRDFYTVIAKEWPLGHKGSFNSIQGSLVNRGWICEEETDNHDNCQGVCLFHNLVPTSSTPPRTTMTTSTTEMKTSTAYNLTDVSDSTTTTSVTRVSGQKGDDEKCSTIVIITTSLAAVFFVVVVVLSVVLLLILRRTKRHQKEVKNKLVTPETKATNTESSTGVLITPTLPPVTKVINSILTTQKQSTNGLSTTVDYSRVLEMTTEPVTSQAKATNTESSTGLITTQTSTVTKVIHSILSTQIQSTNGLSTTVVYPRVIPTENTANDSLTEEAPIGQSLLN
ncbi:Asialoglycoprotein receptor 1 [Desmophyllum pertusum]|uniref:Asialoglycoprotein receptor 1 n=1 Tax=Desmophyllum pertusum TaxID=174260 RepID=A0A9X0CVU0_9CNID|nr:Asialoglycoprotein receptor 1 [Desmophyllum pertusum]